MAHTADFAFSDAPAKEKADKLTLPAPVPFAAPVLIADCTSPLAGETILSLIWRRMAAPDDAD